MPDEEIPVDELDEYYGQEGADQIRAAIDSRVKAAQGKSDPADERLIAIADAKAQEDDVLDRIVGPVEEDEDEYTASLSDVDTSDDAVLAAIEQGDDAQLRLIKRAQEYVRDQAFYETDGKVGI